jgi:hypothetical protein
MIRFKSRSRLVPGRSSTSGGVTARRSDTAKCCVAILLFNIDADEEVTPELENEIRNLFIGGSPEHKAFAVRTKCVFPFEQRPKRFAVSMVHGRLYHTDFARFRDSAVHDSIIMRDGGKPALLKHPLNHCIFRSRTHAVEKINAYSSLQAEDLHAKGRNPGAFKIAVTPIWAFFKAYVLRGHFVYGTDGVIRSYIYAFSRLIRLAKARERFQADIRAKTNSATAAARADAAREMTWERIGEAIEGPGGQLH